MSIEPRTRIGNILIRHLHRHTQMSTLFRSLDPGSVGWAPGWSGGSISPGFSPGQIVYARLPAFEPEVEQEALGQQPTLLQAVATPMKTSGLAPTPGESQPSSPLPPIQKESQSEVEGMPGGLSNLAWQRLEAIHQYQQERVQQEAAEKTGAAPVQLPPVSPVHQIQTTPQPGRAEIDRAERRPGLRQAVMRSPTAPANLPASQAEPRRESGISDAEWKRLEAIALAHEKKEQRERAEAQQNAGQTPEAGGQIQKTPAAPGASIAPGQAQAAKPSVGKTTGPAGIPVAKEALSRQPLKKIEELPPDKSQPKPLEEGSSPAAAEPEPSRVQRAWNQLQNIFGRHPESGPLEPSASAEPAVPSQKESPVDVQPAVPSSPQPTTEVHADTLPSFEPSADLQPIERIETQPAEPTPSFPGVQEKPLTGEGQLPAELPVTPAFHDGGERVPRSIPVPPSSASSVGPPESLNESEPAERSAGEVQQPEEAENTAYLPARPHEEPVAESPAVSTAGRDKAIAAEQAGEDVNLENQPEKPEMPASSPGQPAVQSITTDLQEGAARPVSPDALITQPSIAAFSPVSTDFPMEASFIEEGFEEETEGEPANELPRQSLPLEEVWPVERFMHTPPESIQKAETAPVGKADLPVEPPVEQSTEIHRLLEGVQPGQPTDSKVETIAPRRSRPQPPLIEQAGNQVETSTEAKAILDDTEAVRRRPDQAPATPEAPVQGVVPAGLNPDLAKLWGLFDEMQADRSKQASPPSASQPEQPEHGLSFGQQAAAPVQRAEQPVQPLAGPLFEEFRSDLYSTETPERGVSDTTLFVQRQEAAAGGAAPPVAEAGETASQPGKPDIDELARQVYAEVRRKLALEWERLRR
jgi:hypothetical protein